jgi:hypothetical protein
MKQEITLEEYLKLGGKLDKVNWSDSYCAYLDNNLGAKVVAYEDKGERNNYNKPIFHFTFDNGRTHRYAICFILLEVDVVLDEKYL